MVNVCFTKILNKSMDILYVSESLKMIDFDYGSP